MQYENMYFVQHATHATRGTNRKQRQKTTMKQKKGAATNRNPLASRTPKSGIP